MDLFGLPDNAKVNRVIPKNTFDKYTTTRQKKLFTELIAKIIWAYKLSPGTLNLEAREIQEILIFRVELKEKQDIKSVLDIIEKAIPYTIVFVVDYAGMIYLSTSIKHPHPTNVDTSVIDWTFKTQWFLPYENKYAFKLRKSIDAVYHDFCIQLSGKTSLARKPLEDLVFFEKEVDTLKKEITRLKAGIGSAKQFNRKVELNLELKKAENALKSLMKGS